MNKPRFRPDPVTTSAKRTRSGSLADLMINEPTRWQDFLSYLESGASLGVACSAVGLRLDLVRTWIKKGQTQKRGVYRNAWGEISVALGKSCVIAENAIRERDPKAYSKMIHNLLFNEPSPYEPTTVHQSTEPLSPALSTINIMSVIQEYIAAGLLQVTDQGAGLLGKSVPSYQAQLGTVHPITVDGYVATGPGMDEDDDT